jgi:hypothetical protein
MKSSATVSPPAAGGSFARGSRRDFLRAAAVGGAAVAIPSFLASCKLGETTYGTSGGNGPLLTIDFATGDAAFLKFLSAYKQVQADLYVRAVATLSSSDLTAAERSLFTEIKNHDVIHRDTISAILGSSAVTVTPTWGSTNFKLASDIVQAAFQFEDVCVGLLNGMLQHFISPANIAFALEMQSVEARHAASLRDDLFPKSGSSSGYSPGISDGAYPISSVAPVLQPLIVETLQFTNAPAGV